MSDRIAGDEPLFPELPKTLRDRDSIMGVLREGSRAAREDVSRLWRQQARSLNRFSKALEDFSHSNTAPAHGSLSRLFGRSNSNNLVNDKKSTELLGDIDDNSREQTQTLGEIYSILHDDSERQRKRDLINAQVSAKTLETLTHILKALGHVGSGGGLLEDVLAGKGFSGLFGGGRRKALSATAEAISVAERRPGLISRIGSTIGSTVANIPGTSYIGNAARSARGAIANAPSALMGMLPPRVQSSLGLIGRIGAGAGRAIGGAGRMLGTAGRVGGRALGALGGSLATPFAALGLYNSASDLSEERNTPLLGNEQTGGIMGSRLANYAQSAISGAALGGTAGAAFGGVGAIPGAIAGGLAGLGTAAYADFKPQVDAFASKVLGYVSRGFNSMWDNISSAVNDVFIKLPEWALSKIPTWADTKSLLSEAFTGDLLGDIVKTLITTVTEAEKWIESQFSWENLKALLVGDILPKFGGGGGGGNKASPNTTNAPSSSSGGGFLGSAQSFLGFGSGGVSNPGFLGGMFNFGGGASAPSGGGGGGGYAAPSVPIAGGGGKTDFTNKAAGVTSNLMKDFGLTKEQAAGITGVIGHESGLTAGIQEVNPIGGGRGGLGYGQWTGPRRVAFENWAKTNTPAGMTTDQFIHSDEANYGFLKQELSSPQYSKYIDAVKQTKTTDQAVKAFVPFETGRPYIEGQGVTQEGAVVAINSRLAKAQQASALYDKAQQTQTAQASVQPPSTVAQNMPGEMVPPTKTVGQAVAQNPTINDNAAASGGTQITSRAGLEEKTTGGDNAAPAVADSFTPPAAPQQPPTPSGPGNNVDLDQLPMFIGDNGMIYLNSHSVA